MRLTYDPAANIAYLALRERQGDVETVAVTPDVLVDIDETGRACGIELLNAREQIAAGDGGRLVVVDRGSGEERELSMV